MQFLSEVPNAYEDLKYLEGVRYREAIYWGEYVGFPLVLFGVHGDMDWSEFSYCNKNCFYSNFVNSDLNQINMFQIAAGYVKNTTSDKKHCAGIRFEPAGKDIVHMEVLPGHMQASVASKYPIDIYFRAKKITKHRKFVRRLDESGVGVSFESGENSTVSIIEFNDFSGSGVSYAKKNERVSGFNFSEGWLATTSGFDLIGEISIDSARYFLVSRDFGGEEFLYFFQVEQVSEGIFTVTPWKSIGPFEQIFYMPQFWSGIVGRFWGGKKSG